MGHAATICGNVNEMCLLFYGLHITFSINIAYICCRHNNVFVHITYTFLDATYYSIRTKRAIYTASPPTSPKRMDASIVLFPSLVIMKNSMSYNHTCAYTLYIYLFQWPIRVCAIFSPLFFSFIQPLPRISTLCARIVSTYSDGGPSGLCCGWRRTTSTA